MFCEILEFLYNQNIEIERRRLKEISTVYDGILEKVFIGSEPLKMLFAIDLLRSNLNLSNKCHIAEFWFF
jgi:hypothetical protein